MKPLRTIILAAGRGVRMNSDLPKVLHPVAGKPMIRYGVDLASAVSSAKTYVVVGFKNEDIRETLGSDGEIVVQKRFLGTADAVRCAAFHFKNYKGDVLVLSGDTPLLEPRTIKQLIQKHRHVQAACTVLTAEVADACGYGRIVRDHRDGVATIREERDASPQEKEIREINAGVYCFDAQKLFRLIPGLKVHRKKNEFYLTDTIGLLVDQGETVETLKTTHAEEALGINTREDLASAEAVIRKRILKNFMTKGITIVDPETTFIAADVQIGRDTVIRPFTIIENDVRIGRGCRIGPFCRLRPGTRLADCVEVGNFTEISRSHLGQRSLMKHFSFLGDARVGSRVNIGAGAVTANFDGKRKNRTTILDEAFIGSDSILVAPVRVGRRAATGAGAVLTPGHSIPAGRVAMGVPAKVISRRKF